MKFTGEKSHSVVYFDLETSGLAKTDEILQIGAIFENFQFCEYITPTKNISHSASQITGLTTKKGHLFKDNKEILTVNLKDALLSFHQFLCLSGKPVLLVAHNAKFDASHLIGAITNCNLQQQFSDVIGFTDSIAVLKKHFPDRKGAGMFKLGTLAKDLLELTSDTSFHDALFDVEVLKKLIDSIDKENELLHFRKNYDTYLQEHLDCNKLKENLDSLVPFKSVVSQSLIKKMARASLTVDSLKECYRQKGEEALLHILSEKLEDSKPRVTNNKKSQYKIINKIKNS